MASCVSHVRSYSPGGGCVNEYVRFKLWARFSSFEEKWLIQKIEQQILIPSNPHPPLPPTHLLSLLTIPSPNAYIFFILILNGWGHHEKLLTFLLAQLVREQYVIISIVVDTLKYLKESRSDINVTHSNKWTDVTTSTITPTFPALLNLSYCLCCSKVFSFKKSHNSATAFRKNARK